MHSIRLASIVTLSSLVFALPLSAQPSRAPGNEASALSPTSFLYALGDAGQSAGAIIRADNVLGQSPARVGAAPDTEQLIRTFADTHPQLRVSTGAVLRVQDPTIAGTFRVVQKGLIDNAPLPTAFAEIARLLELNPSPLVGAVAGTGHIQELGRISMQINPIRADQLLDEYVRMAPGTVWLIVRSRINGEEVDLLTVRFRNGDVVRHLAPVQIYEPIK